MSDTASPRDQKLIDTMPQMHAPACPRCRYEPLEFSCNMVRTAAGHVVCVIWCGHCGQPLNIQFVGMDQPESPVIHRVS